MFLVQSNLVADLQRGLLPLHLLPLFLLVVQPLPHLARVAVVHVVGCHAYTAMKRGVVSFHQGVSSHTSLAQPPQGRQETDRLPHKTHSRFVIRAKR